MPPKNWPRESVDFCRQAILAGAPLVQIVRACVEQLGVLNEEALALYDEVRQSLAATSPLQRSIAHLQAIYRRAMAAKRFSAAAKVQSQVQALEEQAAREEATTSTAQALTAPRTAEGAPGKPLAPRARRVSLERMREMEWALDSTRPHGEIVEELSAKWGLHRRQVERIMSAVYKTWEVQSVLQGPHRRNEMRRRFETLAREAKANGEYHAAIIANDRICRLDGLYAPQKIDLAVGVQMVAVPEMTDAEAASHLEAAGRTLARAKAAGLLLPAPSSGDDRNVIDLPMSAVTSAPNGNDKARGAA
jgi:hypothetical protein